METPLPIPNREVKRYSADDTAFGGKVGSRQHKEFNYLNRSEAEGLGIVRGAFYFPLSTLYYSVWFHGLPVENLFILSARSLFFFSRWLCRSGM